MNLKYIDDMWYKADYIPECKELEIDGDDLCAYKPAHIDFYKHTVAINILHLTANDTWYLCFDFFHGAVDGRSGIQFVYDFFDVLNGTHPTECEFLLSDCDIIHTDYKSRQKPKKNSFTIFPRCKPTNWLPCKNGEEKTYMLENQVCTRAHAAKLSSAVGQIFSKKSAKMIIPVDIRKYANDNHKSLFGNLFVPIFVDAATVSKVDELRSEIVQYVKHRSWLNKIASNLFIYSKISYKLRRSVIKFFLPIVMSSKKFIYCALVSPLGVINSQKLQCPDFGTQDVSVTFEAFPFAAFTIISLQYNDHTNVTVSWNSGRVPSKTASKLIKNIEKCIGEKAA